MATNSIPGSVVALLQQRRSAIRSYKPPVGNSRREDPVTGETISLVPSANVVFFGPVGSGKSSLIGSLFRAVNATPTFPERVDRVLHHQPLDMPNSDEHGTLKWIETRLNDAGTIVLQDTRGDQTFDGREETIHVQSLKGYFRDDLSIDRHSMFTSYWWSQRFFWQRSLAVIPHAIVFVFDGSLEPFLAGESLPFFKRVFEDCTNLGYEPIVVVTCLDLMFANAKTKGVNVDVEKRNRVDLILAEFDHLNLKLSDVHFVTNFHQKRGSPLWTSDDEGFEQATKQFVDLAMELTKLCNRFIRRKAESRQWLCTVS
ncbi:interferon-induced protein 44-like [Oscarella lobularis]|uniref:interferon-induced protein 44-like n=1 Tax=Oscarella lobularis TaxID=121494 RepID=UPI003313ECD2